MTNDPGPGPRREGEEGQTTQAHRAPLVAVDAPTVGGCRLHERLGQGGMGTVYRATQLALGRQVAVKVVPSSGVGADLVARFQREARTAAALEHPHSLPIYAAGEEDGLLYLVMRLVDGPDLGALIAREGPLAPERAVALIGQIAGALDAAHAAGLVHRDVKPANVLVERRGESEHAYLSDFGLMRHAVGDTAITRVGEWVGSVEYVAPEQIEGRAMDARADVYALAGVLFTALTGRPPFSRANPTLTAQAHRYDPPPGLGDDAMAMSGVIARGMAKAPSDRFASAGELVRAATAALAADATTAPARVAARRPAPSAPPPRRRASGRLPAPGRWIGAGLLTVVAAVAAGIAIALLASSSSPPTRSAATGPTASAPATVPGLPDAQRFSGSGFSFAYPAGWQVVDSQRPLGAFIRTEVESPDGQQLVIVDRTLDDPLTPQARATSVSQSTARRGGGYRQISLAPVALGRRSAYLWAFELTEQPLPVGVDVFQHLGTSGYAVLARGAVLARASPLAVAVARSLEGS